MLLYTVIAGILAFVLVGVPILIAVGVVLTIVKARYDGFKP